MAKKSRSKARPRSNEKNPSDLGWGIIGITTIGLGVAAFFGIRYVLGTPARVVSQVYGGGKGVVKDVYGGAKGVTKDVYGGTKSVVKDIWGAGGAVVGAGLKAPGALISSAGGAVKATGKIVGSAASSIKNFFSGEGEENFEDTNALMGGLDYDNAVTITDTQESTEGGFEIVKDGGGNEFVILKKPPTNEAETHEGLPILMPIHEVQLADNEFMYVFRDVYGTIYKML